ncbi:MAG: hypothetical protein D4R88_04050 [Methanosarcinales archaeon]|nr:MAG: hypothetical protein D4R88_04050 [Methanosarcinales archaeon]
MKRELEISSCNILKVGVETNTPMGGDSGHGGRTILTLENLASTDIECEWNNEAKKLEIQLGGDTECETFRDCLKFAYLELSRQNIKNEYNQIIDSLSSIDNEEFRQKQKQRLKELEAEFETVVRDLQKLEAAYNPDNRWTIYGNE